MTQGLPIYKVNAVSAFVSTFYIVPYSGYKVNMKALNLHDPAR